MKGCVEYGYLPGGRREFFLSRPDASKLYRIVQRRECSQPIDFFFDVFAMIVSASGFGLRSRGRLVS